ncbi:MAG TPA: hypothetical protein VGP72_21700 [Planctomycetota bacterium]|jgi:hypothetical protein
MRNRTAFLLCVSLGFCWVLAGNEAHEEVLALKQEALEILKANANRQATPEQYAMCILKLERAQALLEADGDNSSDLAREVGASLFWARRFSNVQVIAALQKLRASQPALPTKTASVAAEKPPENETPEMRRNRLADEALAETEKYVKKKKEDDYAVALAWFKLAGEHPGTDVAFKALDLARKAQLRFAGKSAFGEENLSGSAELELIKQGDKLALEEKLDGAMELYQQSLKLKDTMLGHRKLATVHFKRAQQIKDELKPKFDASAVEYQKAYAASWIKTGFGKAFEPNSAAMGKWKRDFAELQKEADKANRAFQAAEQEFNTALKLAPGQKDFESAGYVGLCIGVRPFFRMKGIDTISAFLKNYTPENDVQRCLYEFCKTEADRLRKGG